VTSVNEQHPLYNVWRSTKKRCLNSTCKDFKNYGGRGIKGCGVWQRDFWQFVADMGPKPTPHHTLDRINNDGNYEPDNCRWATQSEQQRNKRTGYVSPAHRKYIEHDGVRLCVTDWAARFGISQSALSHRIRKHGEQKAVAMGRANPEHTFPGRHKPPVQA
jgi:hypothetical protein